VEVGQPGGEGTTKKGELDIEGEKRGKERLTGFLALGTAFLTGFSDASDSSLSSIGSSYSAAAEAEQQKKKGRVVSFERALSALVPSSARKRGKR